MLRSLALVLATLLCAVALSESAWAAKPVVGLLPFEGPKDTYRHSIPDLIFWEACYIPGAGIVSAGGMSTCIALNRLTVPTDIHDRIAFRALAEETGVDCIVAGKIERQDRSSVKFRVAVYSASDATFGAERSFGCKMDELTSAAVEAAKFISARVGTPASSTIRFDTQKINIRALAKLEEAIRAYPDSDRDMSDLYRSSRLTDEASKLCSESPTLKAQALWFDTPSRETLKAFLALHRRTPGNIAVLHRTILICRAMGMPKRADDYAREWLKLSPDSPGARIAAGQVIRAASFRAWQGQLGIAGSYASVGRKDVAVREIKRLNELYPENAYLWHEAGKEYRLCGKQAQAIAAHERAYQLNPDSFRLAMARAWDYVRASQTDKAAAIATRAVKRWPDHGEAHDLMARVYEDKKQWNRAAGEMEKAVRLRPDYTPYHKWLAADYRRSGRPFDELRERLQYDDQARRALTIVLIVLGAGFLLAVLIVAMLVCRVLRRDDPRPSKAVKQL
jgi:tetratricopeptide (TPR) repeat protein